MSTFFFNRFGYAWLFILYLTVIVMFVFYGSLRYVDIPFNMILQFVMIYPIHQLEWLSDINFLY